MEVTLPGGIREQGGWHRDAVLQPLSGREEAFLLEDGSSLSMASRVTTVLSRCVCRLGTLEALTPETAKSLTVGDREALLLHLRRMTLGEKMSCVLSCPDPACGEKMDLDLQVSELLSPPYQDASDVHESVITSDQASYAVRFRLPNGADQEEVAPLAATVPKAAADLLLQRCVQVIFEQNSGDQVNQIPSVVAQALPQRMAKLDPQAEILFKLVCPACGGSFLAPFDTADYFCKELAGSQHDFYQEVHLLAFYYHWSEREILSLTRRKRALYLDLLTGALKERASL
jgi:hypothetical protein